MVDDSMEIASEHGHNIVEEDIDIDIDLTTGHVDEDDILDDVDADADFDTNIDDVPAQIETDNLMVDDDRSDASYHMEDVDLLEEEADDHNMEQDPAGMSFAGDHPSDISFNEVHPAESNIEDVGVSDQYWDDSQVAQPSAGASNAQDSEATVYGSENIIENTADSADSADTANDITTQDTQEPAPNLFPHSPTEKETHPSSPQNPNYDDSNVERLENDLIEPTDPVEAINPNPHTKDEENLDLNTIPNENGSNVVINAEDQEEAHPNLNTASDKSGTIDPHNSTSESLEDFDKQNHARDIVVKYNNRNYPLIRRSSTDHPNEFFFEDHSIIEKPFNKFYAEIRKVLMEENLPKDDKISLVIEELQLVIEETQLANYPDNLSLGQIIRLYERLVNNDGTGDIPPLNLRLVIQQTGPDRFFALLKGAAEGKGLLDYVTWDADSEDDPTEFGEPTEHYDSESPVEEHNPEPEGGERSGAVSDVHDENSNTELVADARDEQPHLEQPHLEHAESATSASAEAPQEDQAEFQEEINDPQSAPAEVRQSPEKLQRPEDEVDEDGDFIDYEDEEDAEQPSNSRSLQSELPEADESRSQNGRFTDFTLPCILPATCLCSTCSDLVLTECRAAEEESRRNSLSLRAENPIDELDDQVGEDTTHTNEAAQPKGTFQDVESDIDYEETADDNFKAEEQEHTNENLDPEEGHVTTPNGIENVNSLNDTNDEDREYNSFNENNEIEENGDGKGLDLEDNTLQVSQDGYNETEQDGDGEGLHLAENILEVNNVEIGFEGDLDNGEQDDFGGDEFDLGVGDEEGTEFPQSYQLDHDTTFDGSNEFPAIPVGEDTAITTNITLNETAAETDSATLSNASITEPQRTKPSLANGQDQEDEIDYDDDDDDEGPLSPAIAPQPSTPTSKESPVSNSGKRLRAETDFEDGDDAVTNEAKRIRS